MPQRVADVTASPCARQAELAEQLAEMGHVLSATPEGVLETLETMDLSTLVRIISRPVAECQTREEVAGRSLQLLCCSNVQISDIGRWVPAVCDMV